MLLTAQKKEVLRRIERALNSIGYTGDLLQRSYKHWDVTTNDIREVPLAGFAQSPTNYRNACIGVITSNGLSGEANVLQHRALGAPMIFEVESNYIRRWKVKDKGNPDFIGNISFNEIENTFTENKSAWKPDTIFRAKFISPPLSPLQPDFIDIGLMPALEGDIHKRLDRLLKDTLTTVVQLYKRFNQREPDEKELYRLVFRFIAAKVLRDREQDGDWNSDNPSKVLRAVESYYGDENELTKPKISRAEILDITWKSILSAFHFQNLSVDDLAFIYENTLITKHNRKKLGTHSTPSYVAEFVVRNLPFEDLDENDRYVLEPCSGHGVFLVSAMRRLRELLPASWSNAKRHRYFVERLVGIESDHFAIEVCRLSLMLADYPNSNGWKLYQEDVFASDMLERELKKASIVLCNPPFENFDEDKKQDYGDKIKFAQQPKEILSRILTRPPRLLGMIMPAVFTTGGSYKELHHALAESYNEIKLKQLPEVFNYSDAPTVLILASQQRNQNKQVFVSCQIVLGEDRKALFEEQSLALESTKVLILPESRQDFSLWIPRLSKLWIYLTDCSKLKDELVNYNDQPAIYRGLEWKGIFEKHNRGKGKVRTDVISESPKPNFIKGFPRIHNDLRQYVVKNEKYLSIQPDKQKTSAYELPWSLPKVACNRSRLSRTVWRLGAVADSKGQAFSTQFIVLWPKETISIYSLAAILNSPLANAFLFDMDRETNRVITLKELPLPPLHLLAEGNLIDSLSREIHLHFSKEVFNEVKLKRLILEIDAEILKAYDLPPVLERQLLDTFQGIPRPVPINFDGYYPEGFQAYIPLHELISEELQEARADRLLERLTPIHDSKISDMISWLNE